MRLAFTLPLLLMGVPLAACGDDGGSSSGDDSGQDGGAADAPADSASDSTVGPFALTSSTITEGGDIPPTHACENKGGQNQSPALAWTNRPSGTLSFAITFIDQSISGTFPHGTIYDIPASRTALPANLDKVYAPESVPMAHQAPSYQASVIGWNGPCPGTEHTYQLKIYALSVDHITNATDSTTTMQLISSFNGVTLATATLTANFDPP